MPITKNSGRQSPIDAWVDFTFADIPTTAQVNAALDLPPSAIVVGGDLVVTTAWNSGTSAVLAIGDATVANRYLAAGDLKTVGRTALAPTGFTHSPTERVINATPTLVGTAATAGAARLRVSYIVKGRGSFSQG